MGNKLAYPEVDLTGKVALITGGNTGIGYETAKGLARLGAHTFIACRSKERAESAIEKMKEEIMKAQQESSGAPKLVTNMAEADKSSPDEGRSVSSQDASSEDKKPDQQVSDEDKQNSQDVPKEEEMRSKEEGGDQPSEAAAGMKDIKIEYIPLDLSSFQSTKECVRLFKEKNLPLHILINNAALLGPTFTKTVDDLECQVQINHLNPVLLTLELLPILLETAEQCGDVRIIFVTSGGHFQAEPFNPDTLIKTEENYKRLREYCNTKLYNIMSGYCLQRRLQSKKVTVSSVHPGYVRTEIDRSFNDMTLLMVAHTVAKNIIARTPVEGAATSLNCAVNPELNSQQHFYYDSCKTKVSSDASRNEEFQEQMWKKTFEYLKDHLSPDTIEKYGPKQEEVPTQTAVAKENAELQDEKDRNVQKPDAENDEEQRHGEDKSDAENKEEQESKGEGMTEKSGTEGSEANKQETQSDK